MKLPTDRKERIKVLVLIALGILAALSASIQGIMSLSRQKSALTQKLQDVRYQIQTSKRDVMQADSCRPRNAETIRQIVSTSDEHVLHPILGNYRLGASETINRLAQASGVEIQSVQEVGIMDLPRAVDAKARFKAYTVRLTMDCSFFSLMEFLHRIEKVNPIINIATMTVVGSGDKTPQLQRIAMGMQWPIWVDEILVEKMKVRGAKAGEAAR